MSKFSVCLKKILEKRGEPIARVAEKAGVERTSIHKALKDERILSYVSLKQLIQYLELTLPEIRELNQYYEMLLQGEDIFEIQESICELLSELAQHGLSGNTEKNGVLLEENREIPEGLVCGKLQVERSVRSILYQESLEEELCLYLPQECPITGELIRLWESGRSFQVCQLVPFLPNHSGEGTKLSNLELLRQLVPLALISRGKYSSYYYYESADSMVSMDPFPYFMITPHYLIRMDQKMSMAWIQTSRDVIAAYRKHFSQVREECEVLTVYSNDLVDILHAFMGATNLEGYYTIMVQPCFGRYYTREMIEKYFHAEEPWRGQVIGLENQWTAKLRGMKNYYTIFLESGLRLFAETGVIVDLPPEYTDPLDVCDRLAVLRKFRKDIADGAVNGCIADERNFSVPPYLTLTCDPKSGVHFYAIQGYFGGAYTCNLHIQGAAIGQSFCKFIKSVPGSKFVYPIDKTLELLDELICGLEETKSCSE
ncbi:MAG: helix-turn-helix transcriptional regulator [Clostridiales bacterium]|nr:helix-turn-helix transcriptional regulator [Clostridiales bacterium]